MDLLNERQARVSISTEQAAEIAMLVEQIHRLDRGELDPDEFKRFRLENGIYGIRGATDRHMVRIKVRFGKLSSDQLETLAAIAETFTPNKKTHLTTRQDVQFHNVERTALPRVLAMLAQSGLTTREACGNTVRNVTACPYAGISPSEAFDVRPYADALSLYFLRNPINQNLPRKFKFAFEGCSEDHARKPIHDFGVVAAIRHLKDVTERGFRIYLGGGLGAQPASARLLEDFTPDRFLIPTAEAVLRVFDRYGERREDHSHRMRARLKFLIREWGWEKFQAAVLKERQAVLTTRSGHSALHFDLEEERPPYDKKQLERLVEDVRHDSSFAAIDPDPSNGGRAVKEQRYGKWLASNVWPQKQDGWSAVIVRVPLGDLNTEELRHLAQIARRYSRGRLQVAVLQNLLLRWVPTLLIRHVYEELERAGLTHSGAQQIADITRCPGADTCQIALTHSRGLAEALAPLVENELGEFPELQQLSIKISGCMNSCGQHQKSKWGQAATFDNPLICCACLGPGLSWMEMISGIMSPQSPRCACHFSIRRKDTKRASFLPVGLCSSLSHLAMVLSSSSTRFANCSCDNPKAERMARSRPPNDLMGS